MCSECACLLARACVHASMAVAISTRTLGLRWEGSFTFLCVYLVCIASAIALHQLLPCYCLHSLVDSRRLHLGIGALEKEPLAQQLLSR